MSKSLPKKILFLCATLLCLLFSAASLTAITGDVNGDNTVNIVDALMTAQYYVGINPAGFIAANADVNNDGKVNIIDALMIAQYYVGLIVTFPAGATAMPTSTPRPMPTMLPTPAATGVPMGTPRPTSAGGTPVPGATSLPSITTPPIGPSATPDPAINYFYFSYDDSASTAAVELVKYQVNNGQQVSPGLARPWEFLNFEEFSPAATENTGLFDLSMGVWKRPALEAGYADEYKLGVYIASPTIDIDTRKNVIITLVIDISGSMGSATTRVDNTTTIRMDIVKYGLGRMTESLKPGDVINIITFDTTARIVHQGLRYESELATYLAAVDALRPTGSTNLAAGLDKGYQAAIATFDPAKTNRIVMLTDAYANTGVIDTTIISNNIIINGQEGIYFSGLGISLNFNEAFLNELVEAGKGAYFTLAAKTDAARAFTDRFFALLTVAAKDVQFRLDYPAGLIRDVTASEETSTDPTKVQPTNFSYNTSQYFFEGFKTEQSLSFGSETFKLTVTYKDPDDGMSVTEVYEKPLTEVLGQDNNLIRDAEMIFLFTELVGQKKGIPAINRVISSYYTDYTSALYEEYLGLIRTYSGTIAGDFEISPTAVNFGTALVGERLIRPVTLINNTAETLTVTDVNLVYPSGPVTETVFSHNAGTPLTLASRQSASFNVVFDAYSEGSFTASLSIRTDESGNPVTKVQISGKATGTQLPTPTPLLPGVTSTPTPQPTVVP